MKKINSKNMIAVNATALKSSGALTILKQFLAYASKNSQYHYFCFVPTELNLQYSKNISFVEIPRMNWLQRIVWDAIGFKKYLKSHKINPKKVISLQNTSVNMDCDQIIYLHQSLPFSNARWSVFKKEHFKSFLYKHFYKFFILLFTDKQTVFVVQTEWMKNALCSQANIKKDKVYIIKPDIKLPDTKFRVVKDIDEENVSHSLLYPATPLFYKNHYIILQALNSMKASVSIEYLKFLVTFKPGESTSFDKAVKELGLTNNVEYLGVVPYDVLIEKYQAASLVLFPSYVETFGLPLAEAASLGKPVLCSDLEFARDVLNGYSGAVFLNHMDHIAWGRAIIETLDKVDSNTFNSNHFELKYSTSWEDFFKLI